MEQHQLMPRFFLHVRTNMVLVEDPDGIELFDLEAARAEAIAGIRLLVAEAVRQNLPSGNPHIDIYDAAGKHLATVSTRDSIGPLLP